MSNDTNYTPLILKEKPKHAGGRPTVMDEKKINSLRSAFLMGCTITEACLNADISRDTYYQFIKANKEFADKVEEMRDYPFLKARVTIYNDLDNPDTAKWYMERKLKNEFAQRTELTGGDGAPFLIEVHPSLKYNEPKTSKTIEEAIVEELPTTKDEPSTVL